jgi:hypothetical protein
VTVTGYPEPPAAGGEAGTPRRSIDCRTGEDPPGRRHPYQRRTED